MGRSSNTTPDDARRETMPASLAMAYRAETDALLRNRLVGAIVLFGAWIVFASVLEYAAYPERVHAILVTSVGEAILAAAALFLTRRERRWPSPLVIAVGFCAGLGMMGGWYSAATGFDVERLGMQQGVFFCATAMLLPWGWRPQLVVAGLTAATFWLVAWQLHAGGAPADATLMVVCAGAGSVGGAWYLDRYRRHKFVAEAFQRESAEVASALLRVGELLAVERDPPAMLERVSQLAVEILECDWSHIYLWDPVRRRHRLAACAGVSPEVRAELEQMAFPLDRPPKKKAEGREELIEIPDVSLQRFVPRALILRLQVASALVTPLVRGNDTTGVLAHGYRERTGPFSEKQRRLARGLAHAAGLAFENVRLIADLQAASSFKSEFVATLSHELRTPINVVLGYAEMLADGGYGELTRAQQGALGRVRMAARDLLDLVEETIDLGRIDAGRENVTRTPIDLDGLFREVDREVEPLVPPGVSLRWHNAVGRRQVLGDRFKLKTIIRNLVGNALKFTETGTVEVTAHASGRKLRLAVKDTGIGIGEADLPVIFEKYRQVDGSEKRGTGGVGLGLHIVQRLVGVLGGEIAVKSTPGAGSTFTITLPLAEQSTGT